MMALQFFMEISFFLTHPQKPLCFVIIIHPPFTPEPSPFLISHHMKSATCVQVTSLARFSCRKFPIYTASYIVCLRINSETQLSDKPVCTHVSDMFIDTDTLFYCTTAIDSVSCLILILLVCI